MYFNTGFIPTAVTSDESTGFYTGPCRSVTTLGSAPFRGCPGRLFNGLVPLFGSQSLFIPRIKAFSVIKPMISFDRGFCTYLLSRRTLHVGFGIRQAHPPLRVSQGGGTVPHQVGLLDMTCCGREANPCLEVLWTTTMDDYSSPLSETLRIGYLDTRRVGHCCLAHGTAPCVLPRSRGNPSAPGVNRS